MVSIASPSAPPHQETNHGGGGGSKKKKKKSSSTLSSTTNKLRGGASSSSSSSRQQQQHIKFSVDPIVIAVVHKPREYMNHSYCDFSNVPAELADDDPPPTSIADMSFSQKVHDILSHHPEYKQWIAWHSHGRSFKIFVPQYFERNVCEKYFGHKRYSSFLRCLNNFGFKHITKGPDRNSYYHEFFLEGRPHLCKYMPPCKDARRLVPDPENEPDFYKISAMYPLKKQAAEHEHVQPLWLLHTCRETPEHEHVQPQQLQQQGGEALLNTKLAAAVVGKKAPPSSVTSSAILQIPPSLAAVPAFAGQAAASSSSSMVLPSSSSAQPPMALQFHIEKNVSSRMTASVSSLSPAFVVGTTTAAPARATMGPSGHLLAASSNSLLASSSSASPALGPRLASDLSWLLQQMPPAKVHRPASAPFSYDHSEAASAPNATALLHALDVAQARRAHQQQQKEADLAVSTAAAVALARARQCQQLQLQEAEEQEQRALVVAAAIQARQRQRQEQQQQQQQQQRQQEAALLTAIQQQKHQIVSRFLGVDVTQSSGSKSSSIVLNNNGNGSSSSNNNSSSGQDAFLLEYIRRMKQDGC